MKTSFLAVAIASLAVGVSANAAPALTGSLGVADFPGGGSYTSSSLTLTSPTLITTSESGILGSLVPAHSDLSSYTGTLSGLSATPTVENISSYFLFSTPDATFGTSGTTPNNRFDFNLYNLSEPSDGVYFGTGTLVDTTGAYASSPADFTLSFSGQGSYSFTLATIPEPTQYGMLAAILALSPVVFGLRRRRLAAC